MTDERTDETDEKKGESRRKARPILLEDLLPGEDVKGGAKETRKRVFGAAEETKRQEK